MYLRLLRLLKSNKVYALGLKGWLLFFILGGLSACSVLTSEPDVFVKRYDHALSIKIQAKDNKYDLAELYGGDVLVWRPEAGLAVLGFEGTELNSLAADAEPNKDTFQAPEGDALGTVWASKYKAWAGGWTAWTDDSKSLTTLHENLNKWQHIRLQDAQNLAPQLGKNVKVAILDTGLDLQHPAFQGHLAPEAEWFDFVDKDDLPQEEQGTTGQNSAYGHGTGVAGIILQIAPNVTLLPLRVLKPDGSGDMTDVVAAIDWAAEQGADVINLSLGSSDKFKTLKEILKYASKKEILLVASAGNSGQKGLEFPAGDSETISVGSVNDHDIKSDFSAYGKELELLAPGELIYTLAPNEGIAPWSGTSFAAPIVTGAIVLALGEKADYPKLKIKDLEKNLSESAKDISKEEGNQAYKKELGRGRLDIYAFLQKVFK